MASRELPPFAHHPTAVASRDRPEPLRVDQLPHQPDRPDRTPSEARRVSIGSDPNGIAQSLVEALAKKPLARDRLVAAIRALDAVASGRGASSGASVDADGLEEGAGGDEEGDRWGAQHARQAPWKPSASSTDDGRQHRRVDRMTATEAVLC